MDISVIDDGDFKVVQIDNTYTEEELELINLELNFLCLSNKFLPPGEATGAGESKTGSGIFLDKVYSDRSVSNVLTLNRKIFELDVRELPVCFENFQYLDRDFTLLNYYENKQGYGSHTDLAVYTFLTFLFQKPKRFTGGDLYFEDFDKRLDSAYNRTYIFQSWMKHQATNISLPKRFQGKGLGRYSIACFAGFRCLD